jgi:hypothetical protein
MERYRCRLSGRQQGDLISLLSFFQYMESIPKLIEVTGGWRKLHNEELHNLYSSPSIIRMIKSRTMRWAGHVTRMGEECI